MVSTLPSLYEINNFFVFYQVGKQIIFLLFLVYMQISANKIQIHSPHHHLIICIGNTNLALLHCR